MATEKYASWSDFADRFDCPAQSRTIAAAVAEWRAVRARLPERQIASQHNETGICKGFGHRYKQRGATVRAGTVSKNHGCAGIGVRPMQKAAHRRLVRRLVQKTLSRLCRPPLTGYTGKSDPNHNNKEFDYGSGKGLDPA